MLDPSFAIPTAMYFALGGVLAALALLAAQYFDATRATRFAPAANWAVGGLLGAIAILATALQGPLEVATASGVLTVLVLLLAVLRCESVRVAIAHVLRPAGLLGGLLAVSLGAAAFVKWEASRPPAALDLPLTAGSEYHILEGFVALTDRGQVLRLFAYDRDEMLGKIEQDYLETTDFKLRLIRLAGPSVQSNCHGWVYAGGRFAIQSRDVPALLRDNGYLQIETPQAGDVVIYRSESGAVEHTGLVRFVEPGGLTLVESKWGPLGVYLHPVTAQPYGNSHAFYRSPRAGNLVTIVPRSSLPDSVPTLALAGVAGGSRPTAPAVEAFAGHARKAKHAGLHRGG